MRDLLILAVHLLATFLKLVRPGGLRAVVAESLLLRHQILISNRSRRRAPNLTTLDCCVLGLTTLFVSPCRIPKVGALIKPATLFKDSLWSVDLLRCESILLRSHWVLVVMDVFTRRIIGFGVERACVDGVSACRMFNHAVSGQPLPKHVSTDHDPLFRFHRWLANLRVLEIDEIKSVPYAPVSHPFVERLIGTIRREYLDHTFFWNAVDLTRKLAEFRDYFNADRVHRALAGSTPAQGAGVPSLLPAALDQYAWRQHCHGLFQTPIAA